MNFNRSGDLTSPSRIIRSWFQRARGQVDAPPSEAFEPFIYAWISFNAWAECITEIETDAQWIEALASSDRLAFSFSDALVRDQRFRAAAEEFRRLWPIPKATDLRRRAAWAPADESWADTASRYIQRGVHFEPFCSGQHAAGHESEIPLDWWHFLRAVYRVRCNLFHGGKSVYSVGDQQVVRAALRGLVIFLGNLDVFPDSNA